MTTMNTMRIEGFRALSPNTDGGAGAPAETSEPTNPDTITASDVLKEFGDNTEESKADDQDDDDEEDEDDTEDSEDDEEDDASDADDDEDEDAEEDSEARFQLDPEVAKALKDTNPKAAKRLEEQIKGLRKAEARITANEQTLTVANSYFEAFADPTHAGEAIRSLANYVATQHGTTLEKLLGAQASQVPDDGLEDWERAGYESKGEYTLALRLEAVERERAAEKKASQEKDHLDTIAPRTIKRIANRDNGWVVTKEMVAEAVKALPSVTDPVIAVQKWFSDERAKHASSLSRVKAKKGPESFPPNGRTNSKMPTNPDDIKASHVLSTL